MPTYAAVANISPRMGGRVVDASSSPTSTQVSSLLDQAEAELLGTLASVGIPTTYAPASTGALVIAGWVERYVAGLVRQSNAAAGGDGTNDDGRPDIEWWDKLLAKISSAPAMISGLLGAGSVASESIGIGSHATDLGLSDSDVEATFKRGEFNF